MCLQSLHPRRHKRQRRAAIGVAGVEAAGALGAEQMVSDDVGVAQHQVQGCVLAIRAFFAHGAGGLHIGRFKAGLGGNALHDVAGVEFYQ